jgi:hypothetical protein
VTPPQTPSYVEVDPFDLPAWLGECEVTWQSEQPVTSDHRISGAFAAEGHDPLPCDLLAVDDAYPAPVAADQIRVRTHQIWRYGEVLVASEADRMLLAVPGSRLDPETVLEAVARFARAVGAPPGSYAVRLQVGT